MNLEFTNVYESLLKEISVKNIGIFPGKFKPPHKGHFKTCEVASKENDIVVLLISSKEHEGITAETSFNIWNIYKKYIPNIVPYVALPSPVLATYDLVNILNTGSLDQPFKSNAKEIIDNSKELESYLNVGNGINVNLYSSPEDQERYMRMKKQPFMGRSVLDIKIRPVARLASATDFRAAITGKGNISSFLPSTLSNEDKLNIVELLV
jgi:cytidyltransferase-like protein